MSKASTFLEMAAPLQSHKEKDYYHGTSTAEAAKEIMSKGIVPYVTRYVGAMKPVSGRVYITPDIALALWYTKYQKTWIPTGKGGIADTGRYAYVFVIKGSDLKDIQPDEDDIVKAIQKGDEKLGKLAFDLLNPRDQSYMKKRDMTVDKLGFKTLLPISKKILKGMTDEEKLSYIDKGGSISHKGTLHPSEVWQVDREDKDEFKEDGSNFFQVAKKVTEIK